YCQALNEALHQEMAKNPDIFVFGIGVPDHKSVFGSTRGLLETFGPDRCFDTPLCEDSMTGFALGAALGGMRPVHIHIRVDFLLLAMNQIVNMIASYNYSLGGKVKLPIVIRTIIGRGWGQGMHHSKSLQSYFAHIPGLKVVMPTTPRDAKGLLTAALRDNNPVIFIEHRWLYWAENDVPEGEFLIPLGQGNILREGTDLTIVATSWMNVEALRAADLLAKQGVYVEVVDPRTIAPLDEALILRSVEKTGHCLVADNDWVECGFSAEVAARVAEKCFGRLKSPVRRLGFAHTPCPTVRCLEDEFYPNAKRIVAVIHEMLGLPPIDLSGEFSYSHESRFKGPF
ncbi:MAG: alpha-ketoacid dehydrogenase subunit beta, partial [Magnetococcales bacterium]|nr:alpha-ketoacid dehydrogenase subunit beta [Magnetococcales bacterium]